MMEFSAHTSKHILPRSITTMRHSVHLLRPGSISTCQFPRRRDYPVALLTQRTLRQHTGEILSARKNAPGRVTFARPTSAPARRPG